MIDATVGQRRRTINLLGQTPDQGDFDWLEDGQVILRQRDDKSFSFWPAFSFRSASMAI